MNTGAVPEIHGTRCVRYRFRYSECSRCAEACPHEAVRLSDEGASIDTQACRGCGLCVNACRTEAFSSPDLAPLALIEKANGHSRFTVACAPSGAHGDAIVPCLGALGSALLVYLAHAGTAVALAGSDHCAECAHGERGSDMLALNLEAAERLRAATTAPNRGDIELQLDAPRRAIDVDDSRRSARRGFFRRLAVPSAVRSTQAHTPAPLRAIRAARVMPAAQRDLLQLLALADLASPLEAHPALPAGAVRLGDGCTGCEACARACPTGALQVRESVNLWALGLDDSRCVGCGVCIETCQPRVLQLAQTLSATQFSAREAVALCSRPKRRCARCDRSFVFTNGATLCEVCSGDELDFAAIFR